MSPAPNPRTAPCTNSSHSSDLIADRSSSLNSSYDSFRIFQGRILEEYARVRDEYSLTEIDATRSIGEQQQLMRQMIDETLADYEPPSEALEREYAS